MRIPRDCSGSLRRPRGSSGPHGIPEESSPNTAPLGDAAEVAPMPPQSSSGPHESHQGPPGCFCEAQDDPRCPLRHPILICKSLRQPKSDATWPARRLHDPQTKLATYPTKEKTRVRKPMRIETEAPLKRTYNAIALAVFRVDHVSGGPGGAKTAQRTALHTRLTRIWLASPVALRGRRTQLTRCRKTYLASLANPHVSAAFCRANLAQPTSSALQVAQAT